MNESEAVLLVDASNAFDSLNHQVALLNIKNLVSTSSHNPHQHLSKCNRVVCRYFYSQEGTTQGNLLAMPMYAIAILHLIHCLDADVTQVW